MKKLLIIPFALIALGLAGCSGGGTAEVTNAGESTTENAAEATPEVSEKSETVAVDTEASKLTWLGKKVTGEHYGEIKLSKGELMVTGDEVTGGSFTIDMNSIVCTDIEDENSSKSLVDHLKAEDFFGTEKHPTGMFKITNIKKMDGDKYSVTGDLTLKDKTAPVTFEAMITKTDKGWKASAEKIMVDRTKYGITYGSGSFFDDLGDRMINDEMEIGFELMTK